MPVGKSRADRPGFTHEVMGSGVTFATAEQAPRPKTNRHMKTSAQ